MSLEERPQKFHVHGVSLTRSGEWFWLVEANYPCGWPNRKHYLGLRSDTSSVENFRARFSDVISQENQRWCHEMSRKYLWDTVFSWLLEKLSLLVQDTKIAFVLYFTNLFPTFHAFPRIFPWRFPVFHDFKFGCHFENVQTYPFIFLT